MRVAITQSFDPLIRTRGRYTRFFTFTRVSPGRRDVESLIATCKRIDACVGFSTETFDGVVRLSGFIVLRGPKTYADDLCPLFPNFLITPMKPTEYMDFEGQDFVIGKFPFDDIRRKLFTDDGCAYKDALRDMGAPDDWTGSIDDWLCFNKKTRGEEHSAREWQMGGGS